MESWTAGDFLGLRCERVSFDVQAWSACDFIRQGVLHDGLADFQPEQVSDLMGIVAD